MRYRLCITLSLQQILPKWQWISSTWGSRLSKTRQVVLRSLFVVVSAAWWTHMTQSEDSWEKVPWEKQCVVSLGTSQSNWLHSGVWIGTGKMPLPNLPDGCICWGESYWDHLPGRREGSKWSQSEIQARLAGNICAKKICFCFHVSQPEVRFTASWWPFYSFIPSSLFMLNRHMEQRGLQRN